MDRRHRLLHYSSSFLFFSYSISTFSFLLLLSSLLLSRFFVSTIPSFLLTTIIHYHSSLLLFLYFVPWQIVWWLILYWVLTYFKKLSLGTFVKLNISLHSWRRYTLRIWSYLISSPLFSLPTHLCGYGQRLCDLRDFARNSWKACLGRTDKRMMWCRSREDRIPYAAIFADRTFLRFRPAFQLFQLGSCKLHSG